MTQQNNMFAFGTNVVTRIHNNEEVDCPCPATKAGYNPDNDAIVYVATTYDSIIQWEYNGEITGIIDESTAKEAWDQAIDELSYDQLLTEKEYDDSISQAKEVKKSLGWD